jgi:hypothetical protein
MQTHQESTMSEALVHNFTIDTLRDVLQQAGYRVEVVTEASGAVHLRSATGGVPFDLRLGNKLGDDGERYLDATMMAMFQVQGELPPTLVDTWNNTRRFARLHVDRGFLILDQDLLVAGGVTAIHLRALIEIWDRLVQELVPYLRDQLTQSANGAAAAALAAPQADGRPAATAA